MNDDDFEELKACLIDDKRIEIKDTFKAIGNIALFVFVVLVVLGIIGICILITLLMIF